MTPADFLKKMKGTRLLEIGRAAGMAWLHFGSDEGSVYALHFHCPFRLQDQTGILIANEDIYVPASSYSGDEADFDYDVFGSNLFDEKAGTLKNRFTVKGCSLSRFYDLHVALSDDAEIMSFSDHSTNEEQWRLFEWVEFKTKEERDAFYDSPNGHHLVVGSEGLLYPAMDCDRDSTASVAKPD